MTNIDILKKQILYRSSHRGTKEMDLLLGSFVKLHIDRFNEEDLKSLDKLLFLEDEVIYKWYFENIENDLVDRNSVSKFLRIFKL
jgi:antitoxin CptB